MTFLGVEHPSKCSIYVFTCNLLVAQVEIYCHSICFCNCTSVMFFTYMLAYKYTYIFPDTLLLEHIEQNNKACVFLCIHNCAMLGDSTITRASVLLADFPAVFFLFYHGTIENSSTDNLSRAINFSFTGLIFYPLLNSPNLLLNARIP